MSQPHMGYGDTWHAPSRDMISGLCYVQTRQVCCCISKIFLLGCMAGAESPSRTQTRSWAKWELPWKGMKG